MTEQNPNKYDDLTEAANDIVLSINELNRQTGGQLISLATRAKRNRRMIWGLAISLALDVILTLFMVNLTNKVDEAQKLTKSQVLCPLYQQFINADTPEGRERAKMAGQDLKARDEAFVVIRHSYNVLKCSDVR